MWKSLAVVSFIAAIAPPANAIAVQPRVSPSLPVHIVGRVANSNGGFTYQWPGVYFEGNFKDGLWIDFNDSANNFNLLIDDKPYAIIRKPGQSEFHVYPGRGNHSFRLEKRSETQYATGTVKGFYVSNEDDILPPPTRARQIEFIGDSYTVGYGNTSAFTQCTPDEIFETTDSQQGFGPLTARHFNADYQVNAFSGLGMVRNYDGHEHPKYHMPMLYPRAVFDDPAAAVQTGWHPQIVVIGIGGNDFSTPLHDDEPWKTRDALRADYKATFVKFVQDVRAHNPQAFILIDSPDTDRAEYHDAVTEVVDAVKAAGETRIAELILPHTDNNGCNGHPNIHDDHKVSAMLTAYIEAHPEVWQGK